MTRQEQIIEILTWWDDIIEKEYKNYTHEERLNHLLDDGFNMDELIEACSRMN